MADPPVQFSDDLYQLLLGRLRADGVVTAPAPQAIPPSEVVPPSNNPSKVVPPSNDPSEPDDLRAQSRYVRMVNNPPAVSDLSIAPRQAPKPAPDQVHAQSFRKKLDQMVLEESAENKFAEILQITAVEADEQNPYIRKARDAMANVYTTTVEKMAPHIPEEEYWYAVTVNEYAEPAFLLRIRLSRNRDGGMVQSRTAHGWLYHFLWIIVKYTRNPTTGEYAGLTVLRKYGLLERLEGHLKWAVREYGLPTHLQKQVRLDRSALQLMIEGIIERTVGYGRHGGIQTILGIDLCFYGAFRSGSLQANIEAFRDQQMYLKIEDCTVNVLRPGCWSLVVDIKHWKGYSGVMGRSAELTFGPVSKAHNLNFEAPLYFVMDLLARGALENIETLDQLFEFNGAVLPIKPDFGNLPVLLKQSARGFSVEEGVPIGPHKLSAHIHKCALDVGISGGSVHAIRRASGDKFAISMGKDKTAYLLNHGDRMGITFDEHYSTGLKHTPIVDIMLDELTGDLTEIELKTLRNMAQSSPAFHVLIHRSKSATQAIDTSETVRRKGTTEDELAQLESDPAYSALLAQCEEAWDRIVDMYPEASTPFAPHCSKLLKGIMKNDTTFPEPLVEARVTEFKKLNKQASKLRQKILARFRARAKTKAAKAKKDFTVEERDAAAQELDKPTYIITEVSDYLRSKRTPTALKISDRDARRLKLPQEIQHELEEEAEEEMLADGDEEKEEDEDENKDEITMIDAPAAALAPTSTTAPPKPGKSKITQLDINFNRLPQVTRDVLEDGDPLDDEPKFDDSQEPDTLGIPVDVMRKLDMRYLYQPLLDQQERGTSAKKGRLLCKECLKFPSRAEKEKVAAAGGMPFETFSALEKHRREQHDEWSNLELQMVRSDDTGLLKCPACPFEAETTTKTFNHMRLHCPSKDKFAPLYEAHKALRPTEQADVAARQDRRREARLIGTNVFPEDDTLTIAEKLKANLETPGMLQNWAKKARFNQAKSSLRGLVDAALQHPSGSNTEPVEALHSDFMDDILKDTIAQITTGPYAEDLEDYNDGYEASNVE
ncbi:hypothetical protein FRC08_002047 [Ceratobasidium sp. 394]|nr:hypothetical protein FRC08_002047 [Ceratobasidium sp. 394]